jgi:hypothetical protein
MQQEEFGSSIKVTQSSKQKIVPTGGLQLTHFGSDSKLTVPDMSSLDEGQKEIFKKLGNVAKQQQGFTAFLPSGINQNLRNGVGKGVSAGDLLKYLKETPASQTFSPLDKVLQATGGGVNGSSTIQKDLINRLEKMRPDRLLFDKDLGPMYQNMVKNRYPSTYKILKQPMQWRMDTKETYSKLGITKPTSLENASTREMLMKNGIIVQNKGLPLSKNITSQDKAAMKSSLKPGQIALYRNKDGKLNFVGSSGKVVGTSYTGGVNIPSKLSKLKKFLVTKNKGGIMSGEGSIPSLLTPGEFVVNKDAAASNRSFLDALNAGKVKRFNGGTPALGSFGGNQTERMDKAKQRLQNIKAANVSAPVSKIGGMAGAAAFPALIAGPVLQASSNELAQKMGSAINSLTPFLFGMQLLGPIVKSLATRLPLLFGPVGVAVAGVAALGVVTYKVIEQMNKMRDSGAELTRAMYGSSKTVDQMAAAFGKQSATQQLTSRRAQEAGGAVVSTEAQAAADQFMQTDIAKQMLVDIEKVKAAGGDAATAIRNQLTRSILAGAIDPEQARAIAISLGTALGDQKLAIDISGKLSQLIGPNGELIQNNIMKIYAEITPQFDTQEIQATAEQQYAQNTGGFLGTLGSFFDNKDIEVQKIAINDITERTVQGAKAQKEALDAITLAYETGQIKIDEYNQRVKELSTISSDTAKSGLTALANQLGVTVDELNKISKQKVTVSAGKAGSRTAPTRQAQQILNATKEMQSAAEQSLASMGLDKKITEQITSALSGQDITKQFEDLGTIAGGAITRDLAIKIAMAANDPSLVDKIMSASQTKGPGKLPPVAKEGKGAGLDGVDGLGGAGEKSKIQILKDNINLTREQTKATQYLINNGIKPEGLALLDAETAVELMTKKRKDLIKEINKQATAQRILGVMSKSSDERRIDLLNLQTSAIDSQINNIQRQIDATNRLNTLDQRQIEIRQRALDALSKKESSINKLYEEKISALDRVAKINDRIAQQEQNRITLATALTTGDISAAATAASQMTSDFAQTQVEDTKAALEAQRQRELEGLTVSVNNQLMTREQVQLSIDEINERIYQRTQSTLPLEDQIYQLNLARQNINYEIEQINYRIQSQHLIEEQQLIKNNTILGKKVGYVKELRDYYKEAAYWSSQAASGKYAKYEKKAFGGKIKGMAFGGLMKYTSNEKAPGMMMGGKVKKYAMGSLVPGMGNTDRVPALLTPGEFVVRKSAAKANMPLLNAINSDVFPTVSGGAPQVDSGSVVSTNTVLNNTPVYNYSINVNVPNTSSSPEEIANVVVSRIKRSSDLSIRGSRY